MNEEITLKDKVVDYVDQHGVEILIATVCLTVLNTLGIRSVKKEARRRDKFVNEAFSLVADNFDKASGYFNNLNDHILVIDKAIAKDR